MTVVVFDLDGTLLNTLQDIADSMNAALEKNGLIPHPKHAYQNFVGNGVQALTRRAAAPYDDVGMLACVLADYMAFYAHNRDRTTAPYPGVRDMLKRVAASGIQLCVLSNKPQRDTEAIVPQYFPDVPFALIRGGRADVPLKPCPDAILSMMHELHVTPSDVLYVGDSGVDMQTGKNAGVFVCGVTWGFRSCDELRDKGADVLADTAEQLEQIILRLQSKPPQPAR